VAILLLLLFHDPLFGAIPVATIGTLLIYAAAFLTLWSMVFYLRRALPIARAGDPSGR
jgi:MFS superfamily sulfate permease-like transporter